jgi:uncharacterized membrane protein
LLASMAWDTFIVFAASYDTLSAAEADYHAVREFYTESGLIDTYDAAVITRDADGKVRIVEKHEQPTRTGAWRGLGIGLAGGALVALFPAVGIGAGLLLGGVSGAGIGALAGHVSAGLRRTDLKDLGELLDDGQSGLLVVATSDMENHVQRIIRRSGKVTRKQLKADEEALAEEIDAAGAFADVQRAVAESDAAVREAEAEAAEAERAAEMYSTVRPRAGGDDLVSTLSELDRLRASGALSAEEYESAKKRYLST